MSKAKEFRANALEYERLASLMSRDDDRDWFHEEARHWHARADAAEERDEAQEAER